MKLLHKITLAILIIAIIGNIVSILFMFRYIELLKCEPNYLTYIYGTMTKETVIMLNGKVENFKTLAFVFSGVLAIFGTLALFTKGEK